MQKLIKLIPLPVGAVNNEVVYYRDFGPGVSLKHIHLLGKPGQQVL